MSEMFERSFKKLHIIEGDFSEHVNDSGGATRYGITAALALRYNKNVNTLTLADAQDIYWQEFWLPYKLEQVGSIGGEALAYELFEMIVNLGPKPSITMFQRCLSAFTTTDLSRDGNLGAKTLKALEDYMSKRKKASVLITALNCLQGNHYITISLNNPKNKSFTFGWIDNRIEFGG